MSHHWKSVLQELRFEPVHRRIRCLVDGATIVDSTAAMLVWEPKRVVPWYAVPAADIDAELVDEGSADSAPDSQAPVLSPTLPGHTTPGSAVTLRRGDVVLERAGFRPDEPALNGRVVLDWGRFDWVEEDQPVIGHPHDPYSRIDVLRSDRHVVVSVAGQVVAESRRPSVLYETNLPPRWYLPRDDVRMDLLEASETVTTCAYKGHTVHFSVVDRGSAGRDVAWSYEDPLHDAAPIGGMVCFYNELTDLTIDGVLASRPRTEWSRPDTEA